MKTTRRRVLSAVLPLGGGMLWSCGGRGAGSGSGPRTALTGATLIDGSGEEPLAGAVVVIEGAHIRAAGSRSGTPIPVGAAQMDLTGKFLMPDIVDVMPAKFVEPHYTLKEVQDDARLGEPILFGVPSDEVFLPADLLEKLRGSQTAVAPMLAQLTDTGRLAMARVHVKTLVESGVTVAVASGDRTWAGVVREVLAIAQSGVESRDLLVVATRGGAKALRDKARTGMIRAGSPADLLVLPGDPLRDASVLHRVERTMRGGVWKEGG